MNSSPPSKPIFATTTDPVAAPPRATVTGTALTIIRNRIFAGMVVLLPLLFTAYVIQSLGQWLYSRTQAYLADDIKALIKRSPQMAWLENEYFIYVIVIILSIFIIGSALYLTGLFSTAYVGRKIVAFGEWIISKIPVIGFVYNLVKQIISTMATQSDGKANIKKVVLVEYPHRGVYSVAFATGETVLSGNERRVSVFMPTTPNPTTGFLMMLRPEEVFETDMSIEQASKFLLSFGIMAPERMQLRPYIGLYETPGNRPPAQLRPPVDTHASIS